MYLGDREAHSLQRALVNRFRGWNVLLEGQTNGNPISKVQSWEIKVETVAVRSIFPPVQVVRDGHVEYRTSRRIFWSRRFSPQQKRRCSIALNAHSVHNKSMQDSQAFTVMGVNA